MPSKSEPSASPDPERSVRDESRRRFLGQTGAVVGLGLAAGWTALAPPDWPGSLKDPDGELGKPRHPSVRLPEGGFFVEPPSGAAHLGVARGTNGMAMLRAAFDGIGGLGHYVKPGDVVLLKPNVAFERVAALGATTNPEILANLVQLVREAGAKEVRVCDNPIESPESCFERSGVRRAAVEAGARVYLPSPSDFQLLETPGASLIARWEFFHRPFLGVDKVIGIAPVKDHNLCHASMTTKNWYGLLGGRRNQFHQDIHGIIADLALMMRPTLVVLDGTRVLWRSGPTGGSLADVREGNTIVASTDSLAADSFGWDDLLGRDPAERPAYLAMSEERGLGTRDWTNVPMKEHLVGA